jgi:hypothetical protein
LMYPPLPPLLPLIELFYSILHWKNKKGTARQQSLFL